MKAIVQRSAAIVTFVGLLGLTLSAPQRQHVERFADLLVMAPRRKTLAQLAALDDQYRSHLLNILSGVWRAVQQNRRVQLTVCPDEGRQGVEEGMDEKGSPA